MKMKFILPTLLFIGVSTGSAFAAPNYNDKNYGNKNSKYQPQRIVKVKQPTKKVVYVKPTPSTLISFKGATFSINNGVFYKSANKVLRAVTAPIGMHITSLPQRASRIKQGNRTYYSYKNTYYIADKGGYTVVKQPTTRSHKVIKRTI
jgi:hypothetical protein